MHEYVKTSLDDWQIQLGILSLCVQIFYLLPEKESEENSVSGIAACSNKKQQAKDAKLEK